MSAGSYFIVRFQYCMGDNGAMEDLLLSVNTLLCDDYDSVA